MGNNSAFGSLVRKAIAWAIVAVVAIFLFKIVVGVVAGFVSDAVRPSCCCAGRLRGGLGRPQAVIYLAARDLVRCRDRADRAGSAARRSSCGSSIGAVVPVIGLFVALAYRSDRDEVRRQCPGCGKVVKLHDAMCMRCGTDLEFPEFAIEPESAAAAREVNSARRPSRCWKELTSR